MLNKIIFIVIIIVIHNVTALTGTSPALECLYMYMYVSSKIKSLTLMLEHEYVWRLHI